ncbi:MAG: uncharacterized protein PWQ79_188 [Thermococcaceae archaeon]|nr:uncharacterized protein [Thermococcaceae archaeon]MDK2913273.1 uncharacterized protein [Thermococcaceae archaeon]
MEAVLIAGITRRLLDELLRSPYRTVELRSARNVLAIERAMEGLRRLFMTYEPFEDVEIGTEGLITELIDANELNMRIPWEESDEREITVCRAKVKLLGLGRVVSIEEKGLVVVVKVREMIPQEMQMG